MSKVIKLKGKKLALLMLAVCSLLVAGLVLINGYATERILENGARQRYTHVANYFERNLPGIEDVLNGRDASPQTMSFIAQELERKLAHQLRIYDKAGTLRLDTLQLGYRATIGANVIGEINLAASEVSVTGKPVIRVMDVQVNQHAETHTETFFPIIRHGRSVGVVAVIGNETEQAATIGASFRRASGLAALLALMAFSIPAIGFYRRTREKIEADDHMRFLAHHDSLTQLPNRAHFLESAGSALKTRAANESVVLHFIDIDHFKEVNDRYDHSAGDQLLIGIAERLQERVRGSDIVARLGGDEFVVAQFGFKNKSDYEVATNRMLSTFAKPFRVAGRDMDVSASIGTAVAPFDGGTSEELIRNADTAAYVVKGRGRKGHCYFEQRFDLERERHQKIEDLLRKTLANGAFELHFQPLINLGESRIKGFEALLRMRDGAGNFVPPVEFIPVAEETNLIDDIGSWVLAESCRMAATWPDDLEISVNLSAAQFRRKSVVDATSKALAESGLKPKRLLLEITESLLLADTDHVLAQLTKLKALGASIVMDDFGTGYSSLSYMMRFPFDRFKVDRSFIASLELPGSEARKVVQTIISLGHSLNMKVTAEGVETEKQASILRELKCDDAQGWLFGRPIPGADIPPLLLRSVLATRNQEPLVPSKRRRA